MAVGRDGANNLASNGKKARRLIKRDSIGGNRRGITRSQEVRRGKGKRGGWSRSKEKSGNNSLIP